MITRQFEARIRRSGKTDCDVPVQVVLSYDAGINPYAATATFLAVQVTRAETENRVWNFARELLSAGARSHLPRGRGDVRFRCYPDAHQPNVLMCMRSADGHADVTFPQAEVIAFLADTQELFDEATQDCTPAVDEFLKELLG